MQFSYSTYYRACLEAPLGIVLSIICILGLGVASFVKKIVTKDVKTIDIVTSIAVMCFCGFIICMNIGILVHGGIQLISEKETDAVKMQGQIVSLEGLDIFSFPKLKTEYGYTQLKAGNGRANGVQFTIDGIQCQASTNGAFQVGDYVTVEYLPKSGYILGIYHAGGAITPAVSQNTADASPAIPSGVFWVIAFLLLAGIIRSIVRSQRQRRLREIDRI